jgi:hypothetical protein
MAVKDLTISIIAGLILCGSLVTQPAVAQTTASLLQGKTDYQAMKEQAQTYVAAHPELDKKIARAIASNSIHKGMTMEQVTAAWGEPAEVQRFHKGAVQYWFFGCHWPHHCVGLDIGMSTEEIYQSRALFEDGKVVEWEN